MSIMKLRGLDGSPLDMMGLDVALGCYPGVFCINKFGTNEDVGTSFEDIWGPGGLHVHLPTPTTLEVASTDANDTAAGTGARTVRIDGHDSTHRLLSETVTMNGLTPVVTVELFAHVHRVVVVTAGSTKNNEGILYVADDSTDWTVGVPDTAASVQAGVPIAVGQSQIARYTVPMGHTAFLIRAYVSAAANKTVDFQFRLFNGSDDDPVDHVFFSGTLRDGQFVNEFGVFAPIFEMNTMRVCAKVDSTTAVVSAGFDVVIVPNKHLS